MGRGALALLLIPSLAFADAPLAAQLEPRLKTMTTPQLLEEHEQLEDQRPRTGGAIAVMIGSTVVSLLGVLVMIATASKVGNTPTMKANGSGAGWGLFGCGVAGLVTGATWLVFGVRRRSALDEQLEVLRAELDARERSPPPPAAIADPELLAMLAAPTAKSTGSLVVMVSDANGPVAGAKIAAGDQLFTCDGRGAAVIDGLKPGAIALAVSAPGHVAADEAASVVAGARTAVRLTLKADREAQVARLTGVVRGRDTGHPVPAQLEVAETHAHAQVDREGMFRIDVPGGEYTVRIAAPGYQTQTKQVRVEPGDRAIFNVDLHPQ